VSLFRCQLRCQLREQIVVIPYEGVLDKGEEALRMRTWRVVNASMMESEEDQRN
jgi:hypothetical protein